MEWTIYLITNNINEKKYVGLTLKTIEKRWKEHCWWAFDKPKRDNRILSSALRKYGEESFVIIQIDSASTLNEANLKEKEWIAKLGTFGAGYNMTEGGDGIVGLRGEKHGMWGKGYLVTGELNHMHGKTGDQHYMFGKHHSEETRAKMRASHNHISGAEHWSTGKPKSKETLEKLRAANLGRKQSSETIEKRMCKLRGIVRGPIGFYPHPNKKKYHTEEERTAAIRLNRKRYKEKIRMQKEERTNTPDQHYDPNTGRNVPDTTHESQQPKKEEPKQQ